MTIPADFNRRAEKSWIGRRVKIGYLKSDFSGTLKAFEEGWLKIDRDGIETWFSPAMPLSVTLEELNGE